MEKQVRYVDLINSGVSYSPVVSNIHIDGKEKQALLEAEIVVNGNKYILPQQALEETDLWVDYLSGSYQKAEFSCSPGSFKAVIYKDGVVSIYRFIEEKSIFKRVLDEITQFRTRI